MRKFATRAKRPSSITPKKPAKARSSPGKATAPKKPQRGQPSKPKKPQRPIKALPKKPAKAKPKKPIKKKPKKPPAPPEPPKVPLPRLFGKSRHEHLVRFNADIRERIEEAENIIKQVTSRGHGPSSVQPDIGYEYYQLIASIEKMSPHDIYTLFMSP